MNNQPEKLQRGKPYRRVDRLTFADCKRYGLEWPLEGRDSEGIMAVWDGGKRRPPRKGEWYLSGSPIEAYRAPNDLTTPFHIARLVKVRREERLIVEPLEEVKE